VPPGHESIAAGSIGTIITDTLTIDENNIDRVQITTNCADVSTDLTPLRNV